MNIRPAKDEDFEKVSKLALRGDLLTNGLSEQDFRKVLAWLYSGSRAYPRLEIVYEENNEIIGHCGVTNFQFKFNSNFQTAGLVGNLVVDKLAKKQGIFFKIQQYLVSEYPKGYCDFLYAPIVRKEVLQIQKRMGWKVAGEIFVYVRPVNFIALLKKNIENKYLNWFIKYPALLSQIIFSSISKNKYKNVEIRKIDKFDNSHADFLHEWTTSQTLTSVRSVDILNWRFTALQSRQYKIYTAYIDGHFRGYMVLRKMALQKYSAIALVDLIALDNDKEVISTLIAEAVDVSILQNVDLIATAMSNFHPFRKYLMRSGFIKSSEKFTVVAYATKEQLNLLCFSFKKWFINWFDHDFV